MNAHFITGRRKDGTRKEPGYQPGTRGELKAAAVDVPALQFRVRAY